MKTSNYLLLTLILLFFGSFVLVGWNADAYIERYHISNEPIMYTAVTLPHFSVVVAERDTKLELLTTTSDAPSQINIRDQFINTINAPRYEVRNDTLFIKVNPSMTYFPTKISIQCPEIKSFIAKPNSEVRVVNDFVNGKQLFLLDNAKLDYQYDATAVTNAKTKFENGKLVSDYPSTTVKIIAKQSEIKFYSSKTIVDLDLDLNGSYFHLENVMNENAILFSKVSGFVKNDSRVDLGKYDSRILKMNLKGDRTSTFSHSDY